MLIGSIPMVSLRVTTDYPEAVLALFLRFTCVFDQKKKDVNPTKRCGISWRLRKSHREPHQTSKKVSFVCFVFVAKQ